MYITEKTKGQTPLGKSIFIKLHVTKLDEISEKLANQRHFSAIRRAIFLCMPLIIMGSFANLFINLPLPVYQQGLASLFGSQWKVIGGAMTNATFGIMSLVLVLSISYFLAENKHNGRNKTIHPQMAAFVSLSCLIAIMPVVSHEGIFWLSCAWLGTYGILPAILTAIVATELFLYLNSIKMFHIDVFPDEADPVIAQAVAASIPAGVTLLVFALFKFTLISLGITDIHQLLYDLIKAPFLELPNTLCTALIFHAMVQLLWFLGIHGQNALVAVDQSIYIPAGLNNAAQYLLGQQPTEILTSSFMAAYATIGGAGSTLCLILAILLVTHKGNTAWLAKLSILPGIFNINELLVFGLPIVLNPLYLIPFLLTPLIHIVMAYLLTSSGLIPVTNGVFSWTTPVFLSGYLATNSWAGALVQLINIVIGTLIYLPFVWLASAQKSRKMQHAFATLCNLASTNNIGSNMLSGRDTVGNLFRVLAQDLKEALDRQELLLKYQPQLDQNERVTGVEALLRWPHSVFGLIPPPLTIAIAEETGMIHTLGKWVLDTACAQLKEWQAVGVNVIMSVNVSATQFYQENILEYISEAIRRNAINPRYLEIEITESIAMNDDRRTKKILQALHEMGVRIAIDDFGMGYSSLNYIKNFPVDTLKIDKSLSIDIVAEKNCREIVSSIITLCASLNIKTIVEYVETNEQREVLDDLGSVHYQGYLYSPAIAPDRALAYIMKLNGRPSS